MHVQDNSGHQFRHLVPSIIKAALLAHYPRMTEEQVLYWWRAQSSAFLARFNDETVETVTRMRQEVPGIPFPLSPGVINAHIRGGDKKFEMKLVSAETYMEAAVELAASMPNGFGQHTLLIIADDDKNVQASAQLGRASGFQVIYSNLKRLPHGYHHSELTQLANPQTRF